MFLNLLQQFTTIVGNGGIPGPLKMVRIEFANVWNRHMSQFNVKRNSKLFWKTVLWYSLAWICYAINWTVWTTWIWKNSCSLFAERLFISRSFAWGASAWWSNSLTDITKCRRCTFNSQRSCKCWTLIPQRLPGSSSFWSSRSSRAAKTWSSWIVRRKQVALH